MDRIGFRIRRAWLPAALAAAAMAGCASVQPWERGVLARDSMALDPAPMASSLSRHVHESREASAGGSAAQGGGCGCN